MSELRRSAVSADASLLVRPAALLVLALLLLLVMSGRPTHAAMGPLPDWSKEICLSATFIQPLCDLN